ncbi:unnamed protein product [Angiostrongylus costaricensis]|uniref:Ras-related protein Rab-32 n=1 Tax=Angiostrongylus costaricensis TaxID=334426 RepID=A0A0R3PIK3_ANGCS|nr:unnamed protein product [Angiostrongylus costaricensis]
MNGLTSERQVAHPIIPTTPSSYDVEKRRVLVKTISSAVGVGVAVGVFSHQQEPLQYRSAADLTSLQSVDKCSDDLTDPQNDRKFGDHSIVDEVKPHATHKHGPSETPPQYLALFALSIVVVGDHNCGKSCILLRFSENTFRTDHVSTLGVDFKLKTIKLGRDKVTVRNCTQFTFFFLSEWFPIFVFIAAFLYLPFSR